MVKNKGAKNLMELRLIFRVAHSRNKKEYLGQMQKHPDRLDTQTYPCLQMTYIGHLSDTRVYI